MKNKNFYRDAFWKNLPIRSYIKLLMLIFFIFSILGFVSDLFDGLKQSYFMLFFNLVLSGILGVAYAHSFIKQKWFLVVAVGLHFLFGFVLAEFKESSKFLVVPEEKFIIFGVALLVIIMLAYFFLMMFINSEGIPQVKLKTEMELAKKMHDVLVPEINYKSDQFEIYGKSIPISEIGGDLVDIYENEDSIICYIADVSGHGVSSALFMGMFKSAMHTSLLENNTIVSAIIDSNKSLSNLKKQNQFITVAGINFYKDYSAEFMVAGHLPILHLENESKKVVSLLNKQIPISVKKDFEFKSIKINYKKDDVFVLLSDGLIEVFKDKTEESYSIDKIIKIVEENYLLTGELLFNKIFDEVIKFGKQLDDQSLLIIKCK